MEHSDRTEALLGLVQSPPVDVQWTPNLPGSPEALAEVERELGVELPEQYRELILRYDGSQFMGPDCTIALFRIDNLLELNEDDLWSERFPGMFFIGTNNGGKVYFIDLRGQIGRGAGAIYVFEMGAALLEYTVHSASDLFDLYRRIADGENPSAGEFLIDEIEELPTLSR